MASASGVVEALTAGLMASVQHGTAGLAGDIERQLERGLDLSRITCPTRTFHGSLDEISPPAVGTWLVSRLPNAVLDLTPEAGHYLLFPRWGDWAVLKVAGSKSGGVSGANAAPLEEVLKAGFFDEAWK